MYTFFLILYRVDNELTAIKFNENKKRGKQFSGVDICFQNHLAVVQSSSI